MSKSLYRRKILDHYKNPRNFGRIKGQNVSSYGDNPSCGDSLAFEIVFEDEKISDIKFTGDGCAISIASASMLSEKLKNMKIVDVGDLNQESIESLLGIDLNNSRQKCAMLPLNIIKKIVLKHLKEESK